MVAPISAFQAQCVLATQPAGACILKAEYFDNYARPCPIKTDVEWPDGSVHTIVMRVARHGSVETETAVLRTLTKLGFPAPQVLAGPYCDPQTDIPFAILSTIRGCNLQVVAEESADGLSLAKRLLIEGIRRLADVTAAISRQPVAALLPRRDLPTMLRECQAPWLSWSAIPVFSQAATILAPFLEAAREALVFTNGDYQPGNFLTEDGALTGIVDFELAAFHDPLIGLAKYPIYDMHPLNKAGAVADFLATCGYSFHDFAPRLALGCLMTLQREISVEGGDEHEPQYREHVLGLLNDALGELG